MRNVFLVVLSMLGMQNCTLPNGRYCKPAMPKFEVDCANKRKNSRRPTLPINRKPIKMLVLLLWAFPSVVFALVLTSFSGLRRVMIMFHSGMENSYERILLGSLLRLLSQKTGTDVQQSFCILFGQ